MFAFVTVGSTRFDALVQCIFTPSTLSALQRKGYSNVVVQCGNSDSEFADSVEQGASLTVQKEGVSIEIWQFRPSLQAEYERADLVISHAGSGTILDVLRLRKPLIVVPNPTLLDNHQEELATALAQLGHLKASTISDLPLTIEMYDPSTIVEFPEFDGHRFRDILDQEMGFI